VEVQSYPAKVVRIVFLTSCGAAQKKKEPEERRASLAGNSDTLARGRTVFAKEKAWQPLLSAAVLAVEFSRNV
jgi:hypothetical protein